MTNKQYYREFDVETGKEVKYTSGTINGLAMAYNKYDNLFYELSYLTIGKYKIPQFKPSKKENESAEDLKLDDVFIEKRTSNVKTDTEF